MADIDYILSFYHKGEFMKSRYVGGTCTVISELVEADRFSYTVLMEYVKGDLNYKAIGGVYVKKVPNGWKLIANDADLQEFIEAVVGVKQVEGVNLDFYVDTVVDVSIEPMSQMQPHVTVRPRTQFFEGLLGKRFVTLKDLKKQNRLNGKSSGCETADQGKSKDVFPKNIPEYERKRLLRKKENDDLLQALQIKKLKNALNTKEDKEKEVADGDSSLEFDRDYVAGHDSLSEGENDEEDITSKQVMKKKKLNPSREVKTMTNTYRPMTRSRTTSQVPPETQNASPPTQNATPLEMCTDMEIQASNGGSLGNGDSGNGDVNRKRKGRGLAKKTRNWGKKKLVIDFDDNGRPCGGKYKQLATQLGCFIKDGISFPLTTERWDQMDLTVIEKVWDDIQSNTNAPLDAKKHCIDRMGDQWRDWKCRIKKDNYYAYDTDEERLANCPDGVVESQWPVLVSMWGKEDVQKRAQTNKENRSKLEDYLHHTGKKPFAVLKKERADNGKPTDRLSMFIASREGAKDLTTKRMIRELEVSRDELKEANKDTPEELENIFIEKFGEDKHGRMRCLGRGITPTMVYGRKCGVPSTSAETIAAIRAEFDEKFELQKKETEARIQVEREACRIEMELKMEAFKQELLSQLQSKTG